MKELVDEVRTGVRERLRNPFVGAFFLSWIVVNWKAIFTILFSKKPIEESIPYVTENFAGIDLLLVWPLTLAIVYLIGLPYINWLLEAILTHSSEKRAIISTSQEIRRISRGTSIEVAKIEQEKAKAEHQSRDQLNKEVEDLKSLLKAATENAAKERKDYTDVIKELQEQNLKAQEGRLLISEQYEKRLTTLQDNLTVQTQANERISEHNKKNEHSYLSEIKKLGDEIKVLKATNEALVNDLQKESNRGLGIDRPNSSSPHNSSTANMDSIAETATIFGMSELSKKVGLDALIQPKKKK
ncbi:hypothetical protein ACFSJU_14850 [Paradesertivirga mongoliensis]|uniref:Uncharacterized protein n=1 Tax=Paradesertivirga mongoliensis TaxID=2100740 RepID=A0ABW4ZPH9_9SPHI|nr:hypothetical protein [Pedobacter mongoliensis]